MNNYPENVKDLIEEFIKLPSVGPKTAERYVLSLLQRKPEDLKYLAEKVARLKQGLSLCSKCQALSLKNPCPICSDDRRSKNQLCLVADWPDMITIEKAGEYHGLYFILGGLINTIESIGPDNLNVKQLAQRVNELLKETDNLEIILALSPTIEGETTSLYLAKALRNPKIKVSRLARGLPMGSNLEYVDELTLNNAFKYRNPII